MVNAKKDAERARRVIGERILQCREDNNMTAAGLAEAVHVTRQTIRNWEKGVAYPGIGDLYNLCAVFLCDPGYLLGEYEQKTRAETDVCEYVGLTPEAVEKLHLLWTEGEPDIIDPDHRIEYGIAELGIISDLISSTLFAPFCSYLNKAVFCSEDQLLVTNQKGNPIDKIGPEGYTLMLNNIVWEFIYEQKIKYNTSKQHHG